MGSPLITTILPAYNAEAYIRRALRSVLCQGVRQEVIVVDDGSTDDTPSVVREFPEVLCSSGEHRGQAAAMNRGIRAAKGDFVAFLDCDDEWMAQKLKCQLKAFESDPRLDAVFGHAEQAGDALDPTLAAVPVPAHLPGAMLIRRTAIERVGPFNVNLRLGMVIEWYARCRDSQVRELMLAEVVYRRWVHGNNMGLCHGSQRDEYATALRLVLERRRKAALGPR